MLAFLKRRIHVIFIILGLLILLIGGGVVWLRMKNRVSAQIDPSCHFLVVGDDPVDDKSPAYGGSVVNRVAGTGYPYASLLPGSLTGYGVTAQSLFDNYKGVFYVTQTGGTLTPTEGQILQDYLALGGNVTLITDGTEWNGSAGNLLNPYGISIAGNSDLTSTPLVAQSGINLNYYHGNLTNGLTYLSTAGSAYVSQASALVSSSGCQYTGQGYCVWFEVNLASGGVLNVTTTYGLYGGGTSIYQDPTPAIVSGQTAVNLMTQYYCSRVPATPTPTPTCVPVGNVGGRSYCVSTNNASMSEYQAVYNNTACEPFNAVASSFLDGETANTIQSVETSIETQRTNGDLQRAWVFVNQRCGAFASAFSPNSNIISDSPGGVLDCSNGGYYGWAIIDNDAPSKINDNVDGASYTDVLCEAPRCNIPIKLKGQTVHFYEYTGGPMNVSIPMNDTRLNKLGSDPTPGTADLYTGPSGDESYDFYISDADGTPNPDGAYITSYMFNNLQRTGGARGHNLDAILIQDGGNYYPATTIASYDFGYGTTFADSNIFNSLWYSDGISGLTYLGDSGSRVTVGFCTAEEDNVQTFHGVVQRDDGIAGLSGGVCTSPLSPIPYTPTGDETITVTYNGTDYTTTLNPDGSWSLDAPMSLSTGNTVSLSTSNGTAACGCPSGCSYSGITDTTDDLVFYYQPNDIRDPWWQTIGGYIFAGKATGTAVQSIIPVDTCLVAPCEPYLSLKNDAGDTDSSGGVMTGGGDIDTSNEDGYQTNNVDEEGRNLSSDDAATDTIIENYDYFYRLYSMGVNPTNELSATQSKPSVPPTNGRAYYRNGNMTISNAWSLTSSESMVIFVNGNLTINNTITVPEGGFLAFIVTGSITVGNTVCQNNPASTVASIQGVFVANGSFNVSSTGTGDCKFVGEGIFAAWNGFNLARDYRDGADGDFLNAQNPVEVFRYRPDFLVNIPDRMTRSLYEWQEVAP